MPSPRVELPDVVVVATPGDAVASRWAGHLGGALVAPGRGLLWARAPIVVVRAPVAALGRLAALTTVAGAAAVLAAPLDAPVALPWWGRRYHRLLVGDPVLARGWAASGVALGRIAVVPEVAALEAEALRAVVTEAASMALRPDIRRRPS